MNKKEVQARQKELEKKTRLVHDQLTPSDKKKQTILCDHYKRFLDNGKTERKAVATIIKEAKDNGFKNIDENLNADNPPQLLYRNFKNKAVAMAVIGNNPMEDGIRIIASHIDSPRLDLKQNPLYEDQGLGLLKTHYYGGIRKYQWLSTPLALHGIIFKEDGKRVDITIGESLTDPVFTIPDLLPHLAKQQATKKLSDAFEGEKLNLIAGSLPLGDESIKNRFKLGVLNILHDEYGLKEEDFISAEIEAVPAGQARDIGFDRSMVGAYGQDDRICAYTSLTALVETSNPRQTCVNFFFDKEEIGSDGDSGAKSRFMEDFIGDLLFINKESHDQRTLRKTMLRSACLSADVNAAIDPNYKDVHDDLNGARIGHGVCLTKFTGSGGKSGSSDASAEFMSKIRRLFNSRQVTWQTGELGKIDQGGGGTVAKYLAKYGMDVLDCGPAILSMHAPFEVASKADIYMTYKAYKAFFHGTDEEI